MRSEGGGGRPMVLIHPSERPAAGSATPSPASPRDRGRPSGARGLRGWAPALICGAAMAVMGVWGLDRGSMYGTEEVSYWAAHLPLTSLFLLLGHVDAVHGLYYLMMHAVFLTGSGEVLLRVPSVLGMIAGVMLAARVAQRLTGSPAVSLITGLIMVTLPVVDDFAQVGRSYAIDLALVMAASLVFLRALDASARSASSARRTWILYGGLVVLAGYMHEMTSLMLLAHGVTLLWSRAGRRTVRSWGTAAVCALVAMIPLILISHAEDSQLAWIVFHGWSDAGQLVGGLFGPSAISIAIMIALILLALVPRRWVLPWRLALPEPGARADEAVSATPRRVGLVRFALPLLVLPGGVLLIESAIATPLYGGVRYVLYSSAAGAMLAALGLTRLGALCGRVLHGPGRARQAGIAVAGIVVLALFVTGLPAQILHRTAAGQPQDMHGASAYVATHSRPGDAILYIPAASSLAPLAYPQDFAQVDNIAIAVTPEASGSYYGIPKPFRQIRRDMLEQHRIWEFSDSGTTGMSARQQAERVVLHHDFHEVRSRAFTGVTVMLWVRDSSK